MREYAHMQTKPLQELEMHTHRIGKPISPAHSLTMPAPAAALSPGRRRFLQILVGGSLAACSLLIAGCAGMESSPRRPSTTRRGSGNRGGDAGGSHR